VCRYTWRLWLVEFGDALGGHDCVSLEMHLEAMIVWTWRPWSRKFGDPLGRCDRASFGMHLEAVMGGVWRGSWSPWSSEIVGELGGGESGGGSSGGRCDRSWDSIHWLTCNCGNVEYWVQHGLPRDERLAGNGRHSMMGLCSMRCMQYSVYDVLGVNSWLRHGEMERDDLTRCS